MAAEGDEEDRLEATTSMEAMLRDHEIVSDGLDTFVTNVRLLCDAQIAVPGAPSWSEFIFDGSLAQDTDSLSLSTASSLEGGSINVDVGVQAIGMGVNSMAADDELSEVRSKSSRSSDWTTNYPEDWQIADKASIPGLDRKFVFVVPGQALGSIVEPRPTDALSIPLRSDGAAAEPPQTNAPLFRLGMMELLMSLDLQMRSTFRPELR
jgi:hypothetical protein